MRQSPGLRGEILTFFSRHVVGLTVSGEAPDGVRRSSALSCFVLEVRGTWFLVTAGHTLERLQREIPQCKNVQCHLFDAWDEKACRFPVPFNVLQADAYHVNDDDGLDVALIHIGPLHRRNLEANRIRGLAEPTWRNPPPDMLGYCVIGFPDQLMFERDPRTLMVTTTLIGLKAAAPPPDVEKRFPTFYGKIGADRLWDPELGSLDDMKGLSGGPILGFRQNDRGEMTYYLIAVQSAWRPDLRLLYGPLMSVIANALDGRLSAASSSPDTGS